MVLGKVKNFFVSYDCLNDSNVPVFASGDSVSGRVIIEVTGEIRVKSLNIHAKGLAKVRWTESRNAGSNTAYTQNFTEEVEYLNHRDVLIGHDRVHMWLPYGGVFKRKTHRLSQSGAD
uniref:Arrestin domain containing 3b n=1 Tax=Cyprinus carpio carpio TaxID=630221 RepID=A0A9J8A9M9_CYPCA